MVGRGDTVWAEQTTRSDTASRDSIDFDLAIATGIESPATFAKTETAETWPSRTVWHAEGFDLVLSIANMVVSPTLYAAYHTAGADDDTTDMGDYDLAPATTAIAFDVIGKKHDAGQADHVKYFGQLSLHGKTQAAGTLDIAARVGSLTSAVTVNLDYDMTKTRERLGRLGTGLHAQLELTNEELGVDVELYGYDIDPVHLVGRR